MSPKGKGQLPSSQYSSLTRHELQRCAGHGDGARLSSQLCGSVRGADFLAWSKEGANRAHCGVVCRVEASRTAERNRINKLNKKASLDEERTQFSRWLRQECCQSWTPVINNHLHKLVARSITPRERTLQYLIKERGK